MHTNVKVLAAPAGAGGAEEGGRAERLLAAAYGVTSADAALLLKMYAALGLKHQGKQGRGA